MSIGPSSLHPLGGRFKDRASARLLAALLAALIALSSLSAALAQGETPASARLNGIRHVYQDWNNCGPANLTMALSYFGWSYGQQRSASLLNRPSKTERVTGRRCRLRQRAAERAAGRARPSGASAARSTCSCA